MSPPEVVTVNTTFLEASSDKLFPMAVSDEVNPFP
jgi:hypothetical protein